VTTRIDVIRELRRAFRAGRLTLFLGAGTSVASGVPDWDRLVTQLYINGIARRLGRYTRLPGLVASVGRWAFGREVIPLEVAARGLRTYYENDESFVQMMRYMLYGLTGLQQWSRPKRAEIRGILARNKTLYSIGRLCRGSTPGKRGVQAVITYNYDDLLEWTLGRERCQPIWKATTLQPSRLPIYHVHGFVPLQDDRGSTLDQIVLSEDQYHRAAQDPYSWNNLVQIQALSDSESVGLMVGLSLTDRNLRRILDNLRAMPRRGRSFALMRRAAPWKADDRDVDSILEHMKERIRQGFEFGYSEDATAALDHPSTRKSILRMISDLDALDSRRWEGTLAEFGVTVLWYENHEDVSGLLQSIVATANR
jgi:hypothetical protein